MKPPVYIEGIKLRSDLADFPLLCRLQLQLGGKLPSRSFQNYQSFEIIPQRGCSWRQIISDECRHDHPPKTHILWFLHYPHPPQLASLPSNEDAIQCLGTSVHFPLSSYVDSLHHWCIGYPLRSAPHRHPVVVAADLRRQVKKVLPIASVWRTETLICRTSTVALTIIWRQLRRDKSEEMGDVPNFRLVSSLHWWWLRICRRRMVVPQGYEPNIVLLRK